MKNLRVVLCVLIALVVFFVASAPVSAEVVSGSNVYIGGYPIGISIDVGGLLVESVTGVETEFGVAYVDGLKTGDVIKKISGSDVRSVDDLAELLDEGVAVDIELLRDGKIISVNVKPIIEEYGKKPRLGVKVKDKIYGVGTVTCVSADGKYAALGHEIYDGETGTRIPFSGGHIHACKVIGIKYGAKGEAGAILASLIPEKIYGTVECNNNYGIAGSFEAKFDKSELLQVASRDEVKPGAAQIKTTVDGAAEYYDIEIIKTAKQSDRKEKGIVFRITDKHLLDLTGGVLRGMSGSPIIQNGKLVGAVTHVFLNDFTKGYGVYADFLN